MSIQKDELSLYDLTNLPDRIRKERELKRWREIMAQQKYEQDYLDGFLRAEAQARESSISHEAFLRHKQAVALRWFKYYKLCKDTRKKSELVRQYNLAASMRQR